MRRRIKCIQSKFERLFYHVRYDSIKKGTRTIKAWIGVYLNKPRFKILVNHKVKAEYFKIIHFILW